MVRPFACEGGRMLAGCKVLLACAVPAGIAPLHICRSWLLFRSVLDVVSDVCVDVFGEESRMTSDCCARRLRACLLC